MVDLRDAWSNDWDSRIYGRTRSASDLLTHHMYRTGADEAAKHDPAATLQIHLLRDFVNMLAAALDDEHVDPDIARNVIERVIYGGVPNPGEVYQRLRERRQLVEAIEKQAPTPWRV